MYCISHTTVTERHPESRGSWVKDTVLSAQRIAPHKNPDLASTKRGRGWTSKRRKRTLRCAVRCGIKPFAKKIDRDTVHPQASQSAITLSTMLYSCADWLTVEGPALLQGFSTPFGDDDDDAIADAMLPTVHTSFDVSKKTQSRPLEPLQPSSPSAVDDLARSPRSFEELQRGSLSLATSIEEFNAIIDADMSGDYYQEAVADDLPQSRGLPQLFGKLFFADPSSATRASTSASEIKYGWTPFDDGEFQFASVERDDASRLHRW